MKPIIVKNLFTLLFAFICTSVHAQENPFDVLADSENVKYTYVSKQMLELIEHMPMPNNMTLNLNHKDAEVVNSIQIFASGKDQKSNLKSQTMSIIKKEKFDILLQSSGTHMAICIYSKEFKKKSFIVTINEDKDQTIVCVFAYDCQLKDLKIGSSIKYGNNK